MMNMFVGKQQACEFLALSNDTLKKYRLQGEWIEGIHWVRINQRCVRYNLPLIQDWMHNRCDPAAHQRAIATYESTLLSHQKRTKKIAQ